MAFVKVCREDELALGGMKKYVIDGEPIAVYRIATGFYATSDVCTHAGESLTKGSIEGHVIACPKHGGKFDIESGKAVAFPCVTPVDTYAVEIRGEDVWVDFE